MLMIIVVNLLSSLLLLLLWSWWSIRGVGGWSRGSLLGELGGNTTTTTTINNNNSSSNNNNSNANDNSNKLIASEPRGTPPWLSLSKPHSFKGCLGMYYPRCVKHVALAHFNVEITIRIILQALLSFIGRAPPPRKGVGREPPSLTRLGRRPLPFRGHNFL